MQHTTHLRVELEKAHRASEASIFGIHASVAALASLGTTARWAALRSLYLDLCRVTATYLEHLRFEQDQVMPALNVVMTNGELAEVTSAIRGSVPPPDMCIFIRYMAPAMNPSERLEMLGGMHAGAPPEIFEMFRAAAQACLDPDGYRAPPPGRP